MTNEKIMRIPQVLEATGMRRSTLYHHIKAGKFPKPIKIGERASGWIASEVEAWVGQRIAACRPPVSD